MFNLVDYEKLSKLVQGVYKGAKSHLQEFEQIFWLSLAALSSLILIQSFLPENKFYSNALSLLFLIAKAAAMIPLAVGVIRKFALKKKHQVSTIKEIIEGGASYVKKIWQAVAIIAGVSLVSFIPAGLSYLMIDMGSTSNIFISFSVLLFIVGTVISLYTLLRFAPAFIFAAIDEEVTLQTVFEKSHDHILSTFYVLLLTVTPVWVATQVLVYSLHNLTLAVDFGLVILGVKILTSVVSGIGYLVGTYLTFGALTDYMTQYKVIKKTK